jgi:hypothetical protein
LVLLVKLSVAPIVVGLVVVTAVTAFRASAVRRRSAGRVHGVVLERVDAMDRVSLHSVVRAGIRAIVSAKR